MTPDRFRTLAEAYGGDLAAWPAAERADAQSFAATRALDATRILSAEQWLDAQLGADVVEPSAALRARVLATAPAGPSGRRGWRWVATMGLGLGLAASAVAGVAAGLTLAPPGVTRLISGPDNSDMGVLGDTAGDAGDG